MKIPEANLAAGVLENMCFISVGNRAVKDVVCDFPIPTMKGLR